MAVFVVDIYSLFVLLILILLQKWGNLLQKREKSVLAVGFVRGVVRRVLDLLLHVSRLRLSRRIRIRRRVRSHDVERLVFGGDLRNRFRDKTS